MYSKETFLFPDGTREKREADCIPSILPLTDQTPRSKAKAFTATKIQGRQILDFLPTCVYVLAILKRYDFLLLCRHSIGLKSSLLRFVEEVFH